MRSRTADSSSLSRRRRGHPPRLSGLVYLGVDAEGVALKVRAVPVEDGFLVIHAMPLRAKHRAQYEEARRWRA